MKRKPVPSNQGIMTKSWWCLITYLGLVTTTIGLVLFSFFGGNSNDEALISNAQSVIFTFIVLTETILLLMIRHLYNVEIFKNIWLWLTIGFSIGMQILVLYSPLGNLFETIPLGINEIVALAIGLVIFIVSFFLFKYVDDKVGAIDLEVN
jgi:Ca2+-transporting ATPase